MTYDDVEEQAARHDKGDTPPPSAWEQEMRDIMAADARIHESMMASLDRMLAKLETANNMLKGVTPARGGEAEDR